MSMLKFKKYKQYVIDRVHTYFIMQTSNLLFLVFVLFLFFCDTTYSGLFFKVTLLSPTKLL
jgi:hypothetical protein